MASSGASSKPPKCRVAVVGANPQRVARIISLLHQSNSLQHNGSTLPDNTKFVSPTHRHQLSEVDYLPTIDVPSLVEIEYLPCVATFDSYEDEYGGMVRYLVKLEYHGEHGTLIKGESLAPFFDDDGSIDDDNANGEENPFHGIAAVAIGCGVDSVEDVEKVANFMNTLSSSCRQNTDGTVDDNNNQILIESIQCNAEYTSMKEENEAFRNLNESEKKEAITNQTIGPGKMAKFVYEVAQKVVYQKWSKELDEIMRQKKSQNTDEAQHTTIEDKAVTEATEQLHELSTMGMEDETTPSNNVHIPDPSKTRYACKRCRTVLFGEADLEVPPHAPSLHNFRKKSTFKLSMQSQVCANHCLATTLPWMGATDDMEGKLHCFKCQTKIGHYSWTGAQCSCGTWITPAIMIPMSKVDEMGRSLFADSNNVAGAIRMPMVYAADAPSATIT